MYPLFPNRVALSALAVFALFVCVERTQATDISGNINTTLTIFEDSRLVGDVTCTASVDRLPCIVIGASHVELRLNGRSITGPVDPITSVASCSFGTDSSFGVGIQVTGQTDVEIRGPGLIQHFQRWGILLNRSTHVSIKHLTVYRNCWSGLQTINGVSDSHFEENAWINNAVGSHGAACGGICLVSSNSNHIHKNTFNGNGAVVNATTKAPDPSGTTNNNFGIGFEGTSSGNRTEEKDMGGNVNGVLVFATATGNVFHHNRIVGNPPALVSQTFINGPGADIHDLHATAGANTFEDNFCLTYLGPGTAPCPNIVIKDNHEKDGDEARSSPNMSLRGQNQSNGASAAASGLRIVSAIASVLAMAFGLLAGGHSWLLS